MKRHLLQHGLLLIILFFSLNLTAQEYIFGIKGGINNNKIGVLYQRPYNGEPGINHHPNKEIGYQFGAYFGVEFGKLFVRPEFNYVTLNNNYDLPRKRSQWSTSKFEIPILIGFKPFKPLHIYVGPNFNFYKDAKLDGVQVTSYSDGGPDLETKYVSLNVGIMLRYNRFGIDFRYEQRNKATEEELLDMIYSEYGTNLADLRSYKPSMLRLSIFIDIFRSDEVKLADLFKGQDNCGCPY